MFGSRKYPYPPRGWPLEILKGWGSQKSNVLKQSIKLNWNFRVVELWDSNSHVTQEHMERESRESKLGGSSIVSLVSVYLVYSLQL